MDWIEVLGQFTEQKPIFKQLAKFTLYDHNYTSTIDQEKKTFSCLLNCKKLNRMYHTICQIDGDFKIGQINIRCWLLDQSHAIHGKWQYQKIELTKFAFRYNERSYRNIFIKVNPLNGEVTVALAFLTNEGILQNESKFKEVMADLCHCVGEQSQMIFNTMLEIIFGRQANEPYLKSAMKVNPGFPRYMKVDKLLDKIKSLIATSNFYKIRSDISTAHKNRSYFKKIYLNQEKKLITNFKAVQMALLYEPKFSKKYQQNEDLKAKDNSKKLTSRDKGTYFIKDYIELQEKNQIQFAKHLHQGIEKDFVVPAVQIQPISKINYDQKSGLFQLWFGNRMVKARGRKMQLNEFQHQMNILNCIGKKHPYMSMHFAPTNAPQEVQGWIFYLYEEEMPLVDFMRRNSRTISLSTKLHIMSQICAFVMYLHKLCLGYFIQLQNLYITRGLQIRICGFKRCYKVKQWSESRKADQKSYSQLLFLNREELVEFPYRFVKISDIDHQKCDVMSLGVCLYRILMDKFPFFEKPRRGIQWTRQEWQKMWTVQTEYYLMKGGELVKIIAHLLLKCMEVDDISNRPYVEWLLVILSEVRTSLNGLY